MLVSGHFGHPESTDREQTRSPNFVQRGNESYCRERYIQQEVDLAPAAAAAAATAAGFVGDVWRADIKPRDTWLCHPEQLVLYTSLVCTVA